MLVPGNIIYFDPFYFKNGKPAKPKYFLVVSVNEDKSIIASLPSSQDFVPSYSEIEKGCCELPHANFNCFIIRPDEEVTKCGKSFPLKTYLYGHLLDFYSKEALTIQYPNEGSDYHIWGEMREDIFQTIKQCFLQSDNVKNKFKKHI
ncbi:hypothetical protein ACYSNM_09605 [Myroides sp. LJL116]